MTGSEGRLVVWQERSGFWRWRYVEAERSVDLPSSRVYETREEAIAAARLAYPGVPMLPVRPRPSIRPVLLVLLSAATLGVGLAVVAVAAIARALLSGRRVARRVGRVTRAARTAAEVGGALGHRGRSDLVR